MRLVIDLIKGQDVEDARIRIKHLVKRSSPAVEKLLKSAIANAENNFGLDRDNLYVYDVQVGEGYRMKRWLPRAFGRASQILKRTSNIALVLEERVEGKNRKSKEQMEKEKKERAEARQKLEKEIKEERDKAEKEGKKVEKVKEEIPFRERKSEEEQKKGSKKGWMKKIFQRKAG